MEKIKEILSSSNSHLSSISFYLLIIMLQGCFGCNKCDHKTEQSDVKQSEISWQEHWDKFKYE